ncbi:hypothetical protein SPBR_05049 [Sporothrix brasiliensis 5110]|uniref:AB hydrolase-1 domain-containing protein n=1 Tax=Sporothrix brasiliensis 5110 TaxID=1398154 RepID=A0A0C2F9F0_9PEZI|nr:uncharacterized protein SPBR_05049 [Sporothrix brasiliensis 5110]KIH87678.1 hypothetical protein SPBR_05049 [Sporothrix brasiliensis 5110]
MVDLTKVTTVAETLKHPSYPDATWNLQPTRSGRLPVAAGRGGPLRIGWEVHGEGPIRIVFIMGLGSFKTAWQRQTLYFGHERYKDYSVLLLDNRGMGDSDRPLMRYTTKDMALDAIEVLEHVGFVNQAAENGRSVHVVGLSMGGMVAQELACLIPNQVASLALCCTASAIENTSASIWENLASRAALIIPKGVEESVRGTAGRIFSDKFLTGPDNVTLPVPGTHLVGPPLRHLYTPEKTIPPDTIALPEQTTSSAEAYTKDPATWYRTFDSNYQRFVAQEMHKRNDPRFSTKGFLLQLIACGWHHKSAAQLAAMGDAIDRRRILIIHGTADEMISVPHGRKLIEAIQPAQSHIVEGMGHAPLVERCDWYNQTLTDHFHNGEVMAGRAKE